MSGYVWKYPDDPAQSRTAGNPTARHTLVALPVELSATRHAHLCTRPILPKRTKNIR